jgi:superfamily II DNA or RNA helicase
MELFDFNNKLKWPPQTEFPINEKTDGRQVKPLLLQDIADSNEFLIITGFTSLSNLIDVFGSNDYENLNSLRIVIGFEPDERVRKRMPFYDLTKEVKDYWLKQDVSIKLCAPTINLIEKIKAKEIEFKVIDKVHAKIYVGNKTAILGSSNFSNSGLLTQREANIRVLADGDNREQLQYEHIKQIAENYFLLAKDYTSEIISLLQKILKDADWQEALARAIVEVLESRWMKDYPELYRAIMSKELWPSQRIGIAKAMKVVQDRGNVLIADPTGSGKTKFATALAYTIFHWMWETGQRGSSNALIISPKQVVDNWKKEEQHFTLFNKFESMGRLSVTGEKGKKQLQKDIENASILVIDEAHNYLNPSTNRSKLISPKSSTHTILATATPINKKADDLLRLIQLLDIDNLSDKDLDEYLALTKQRNRTPSPQRLNSLREYINNFIVRRTKKELNRMIDREPDSYMNKNGRLCRYPKHISDTYITKETVADKEIAKRILQLTTQLKGIHYLQQINFPPFLKTDDEKKDYLTLRLKSAPALAAFMVRAALRSSSCALYEYLHGTAKAKKQFDITSSKIPSGNILSTINKCKAKFSIKEIPHEWLSGEYKWLIDSDEYAIACNQEEIIYNEISNEMLNLSGEREDSKVDFLIEASKKHGKIIAFDSTVLTLDYFAMKLKEKSVAAEIIVATGQKEKNKREVKDKFGLASTSTEPTIALCSDAMSEGINLPNGKAAILLDMPSVLRLIEQRIGRIERMDSEHSEIFVYWPDDSEEFALKSDARMIHTLVTAGNLIGNNVDIPKEIYDRHLKNGLGVKNMIAAYEDFSDNDYGWEGVKDSTQQLYDLIEGDTRLIDEQTYKQYINVDATVKTAVSFIESNVAWSFFAFRGDVKRSPKWLLFDERGKAHTDFSAICEKLRHYLQPQNIIQKRWTDVAIKVEIDKAVYKLRRREKDLLPPKKQRALSQGKEILNGIRLKSKNLSEIYKSVLGQLIDVHGYESNRDEMVDYNQLAESWLVFLQPALDKKKKQNRRFKNRLTLRDIKAKDVALTLEQLQWLIESCKSTSTLDEIIASCIIGVIPTNDV